MAKDLLTRIVVTLKDNTKPGQKSLRDGVRSISDQLSTVRNQLIGLFGLAQTVNLGRSIFQSVAALQRATVVLTTVTGSAEGARQELEFLRQTADKLGRNFLDSTQQFALFSAAVSDAGFSVEETRRVFFDFQSGLAGLSASNESTQRVFTALRQMATNPKLALEELKTQLGEQLPGVLRIAANAMGDTVTSYQDFLDKLSRGQINSAEFIKVFSAAFAQKFPAATQGAVQALNRLENAWTDVKAAIGQSGFVDALARAFERLAETLTDPATQSGLRAFGENLGKVVDLISTNADKITKALGALTGFAVGSRLGGVGGPLGALLGGLAGASAGLIAADRLLDGVGESAQGTQKSLTDLAREYKAKVDEIGEISRLLAQPGAAFAGRATRELEARLANAKQEAQALLAQIAEKTQAAGAAESAAKAQAANKKEAASLLFLDGNLEKVRESYLALAEASEVAAQRQAAAVDLALKEKLSAIEASNAAESQKAKEASEAILDANRKEIDIVRAAAKERLALVEKAFDGEIRAAKKKGEDTKDLEADSLKTRKGILTELEKVYAASIGKLIDLEKTLRDKALQFARQRLEQEKAFQKQRADILTIGKSPAQAAAAKQIALDAKLAEAARAQGEVKVAALKEAQDLAAEIAADAAQQAVDARTRGEEEIQRLEEAGASALELSNASAAAIQAELSADARRRRALQQMDQVHGQLQQATRAMEAGASRQADAVAQAAAVQKQAIAEVSASVDAIGAKLNQVHALQIQVTGKEQLDAAKAAIDAIPDNTVKTVTVVTKQEGAAPAEPFSAGGPVIKLAAGGDFRRLLGRLPGFGGGDKVRALLEPGEFVANKFLVRRVERATGIPDFQAAVRALLDASLPRLAHGGPALRQSLFALPELPSLPGGAGRLRSSAAGGGGGDTIYIGLPDGQKLGPLRAADDSAAAQVRRAALKFGRKI